MSAGGSLYGFGFSLLLLTPAGKKGHVTLEQYAAHWRPGLVNSNGVRASAGETLIKVCAAFAQSPLSIVIDARAAVQCIMRAVRRVLGSHDITVVTPSLVERELNHVCAAGCGKGMEVAGVYFKEYGNSVQYCSTTCAHAVSAGTTHTYSQAYMWHVC